MGKETAVNHGNETIAEINPFCYRGYYYDDDTGFYYVSSRYYDPDLSAEAIEKSKVCSVDEIVSMVNNNDIIEIRIVANGKIMEIGSSSDCKAGSSKFFDKLFYVDEKEFKKIEDFQDAIQMCSDRGQITVISIDGVSPK